MTVSGSGAFFDGGTASSRPVTVTATPDSLLLSVGEEDALLRWPMAGVRIVQPYDNSRPMRLTHRSAPTSRLVIEDAGLKQYILELQPKTAKRSYAGASLKVSLYICFASIIILAGLWAILAHAPGQAAKLLPASARERLADLAEDTLVRGKRECTRPSGRRALFKIAGRLANALEDPPSFSVRVFDIKTPNAFAMPNGRLVITRGLIQNATSADEVAGVLAHEMGHAVHLHPEAGLIRGLGLQVLLALFAGGSDNLSSTAGLITFLSYNRRAERQADSFSIALMRSAEIDRQGLVGFFSRLGEQENKSTIGRALDFAGFLSTHPNTAERIAAIEKGEGWPSRPVLSKGEWRNLQQICS